MPHNPRCWLAIKLCCVCSVVLHVCCGWLKFVHSYLSTYRDGRDDGVEILYTGFSYLYIPWIVLITVLSPLLVLCLIKEIRHDALWYKYWFWRMYVLFLCVTLSLYGAVAFDIVFYIGYEVDGVYAVNGELLPIRLSLDVLTVLSGLIILTSYVMTLFRLNFSLRCKCSSTDKASQIIKGPATDKQDSTSQEEVVWCKKRRLALIVAFVTGFIYVCAFVAVCTLSFKKLHCYIVHELKCVPHL